jgi:hypothetical protein
MTHKLWNIGGIAADEVGTGRHCGCPFSMQASSTSTTGEQ